MMWFFRHFWIFISYHIFFLNQVEGAIAIPPSNSAPPPPPPPPPATLLSVRLSVRLSVNRSVNHIFRFLHICCQVTGKEWHRVRNADVSRWLTLGQHWCRWVLLSFHAFVRPTIHGLGFVYCIQNAWKKWPTIWHADVSRWLTLSIHGCLWILLLVCLSVHLSIRAVVIIGRWLLPSLVDTGDICCHYWQHILVDNWNARWFAKHIPYNAVKTFANMGKGTCHMLGCSRTHQRRLHLTPHASWAIAQCRC